MLFLAVHMLQTGCSIEADTPAYISGTPQSVLQGMEAGTPAVTLLSVYVLPGVR